MQSVFTFLFADKKVFLTAVIHSGKGVVTSRLISGSDSHHCLDWQLNFMMNVEAVLVSIKVDGNEKTYKTSGLLFNSNMVLVTGTSLIPFVEQEKWISLFVKSSTSELKINNYMEKVLFRVCVELKSISVPKKLCDLECTTTGVWKCPLVAESVKKLFCDWTFGRVNTANESDVLSNDDIEVSKELMSVFILLKCKDATELEQAKKNNKLEDVVPVLLNLMLNLQKPSRGQEVEVISTPFGSELFINSLSRGIVSNIVGCQNCVILSDARTVSGCEGGPIFVSQKTRENEVYRKVLGMVTCPLTWWRGEWVGFTIGISLMPVLKSLLRTTDSAEYEESAKDTLQCFNSDIASVNFIDETVVLIRSKASWGSGVILNSASGVVITCSHVVNNDKTVSVFRKGNHYLAEVVFKSQDDLAYDLAIIKVKNDFVSMSEANFPKNLAKVGETVIAAGFPFFSERDDVCIRPSIAFGCIARVNPYMMQTTCCVQSGFSGGALFRDKELLGIIISNTRDSVAGALFPHINFIVPSSVFKEPVLKYIKTNDPESLKDLNCLDPKVQALWKLQTSKL